MPHGRKPTGNLSGNDSRVLQAIAETSTTSRARKDHMSSSKRPIRSFRCRAIAKAMAGMLVLSSLPGKAPTDELRLSTEPDSLPLQEPAEQPNLGRQDDRDRIQLPEMGAPSGNLMSPAEEHRLGQAFMRSVRSEVKVIDDPLMSEYIRDLGYKLSKAVSGSGKQFTFFLVDDPVVNAFAGPGGYIGIHTGLVLATESEHELASVMAHEMAHVTQNHLFRAFDEYTRLSGPASLLLLGAVLLGATVSTDAAAAAIAGVQAGMMQAQINFTRANEEEADREGIKILAGADFDPRAMPVFFERLARATRLYESNTPEFLRTHPVTSNRIADALGRAEAYPYKQQASDIRYYLTRASLRLQSFSDPAAAVQAFGQELKEGRYRNEDAQRYGYAMALLSNRQYKEAAPIIRDLLVKDPANPAYVIAAAKLEYASDRPDKAAKILETSLELFPANYPLTVYYAEALLDHGDPQKAQAMLTELSRARPDDINVLKLLGRAAGDSGDKVEAHQYMAEYYYLTGELEAAVRQLEIALRAPSMTYYQKARATAKLNEYQKELQALKESEK